ncbi:hypothetical protein COT72_05520 [archaeon CG10_big_fil_rev_8_21_14_0_10_43_11]|nr:MAG: hypothetical protein COT72_05520 [archaeon CG10_big_fil_rev_8_21_14_0_10_43_11]
MAQNTLEQRFLDYFSKGRVVGSNILDQTHFINYKLPAQLWNEAIQTRFIPEFFNSLTPAPDCIVTIRNSGPFLASFLSCALGLDVIGISKGEPATFKGKKVLTQDVESRTYGTKETLYLPLDLLTNQVTQEPYTNCVLVDDFSGRGKTMRTATQLATDAGLHVRGAFVGVSKTFEGGLELIANTGHVARVESAVHVSRIERYTKQFSRVSIERVLMRDFEKSKAIYMPYQEKKDSNNYEYTNMRHHCV